MPNPEDRLVPGDQPVRPHRSRVGVWLRRLLLLGLLAALLILGLPMALQHGLRLALERASGQPVSVGTVRFLPADGALEVNDVRVGRTEPLPLYIRRASVRLDLPALLEARLGLGRLQLDDAQVSVERDARGWQVGGMPLRAWGALPLGGGFNAQNAVVRFERPDGAEELRLEQLFLEHLDPTGARPARFSLSGRLGEGRVQAEGLADLGAARPSLSGELRLKEMPAALLAGLAEGVTAQGQSDLRSLFEARLEPGLDRWLVRLHEARLALTKSAATVEGAQIQGEGDWSGEASFRVGDAGLDRLAAHGIVNLAGLSLDQAAGVHLAAASLRWEGAMQQADEGWSVDGDARLHGAQLQHVGGIQVAADSAELWGLSGRPTGSWHLGRMRLQQAKAGGAGGEQLPLSALELVGLALAPDAPPALERLRLLGLDATLAHDEAGWRLQGMALNRLPPLRLALLEVDDGSRLKLVAGGRPQVELDEVQMEISGLDGAGGADPAQLQLHARLGGGTVYAGFDLRPTGEPALAPQQLALEAVPLAALAAPLEQWLGVRPNMGSLGGTLRRTDAGLHGELILKGPLLASVQPDPFLAATGRPLPEMVALLRDPDGDMHLPMTLDPASEASPAAQIGAAIAAALQSAYGGLLAGPVNPQRLDDLKLAPLPRNSASSNTEAQVRLAELIGALSRHPQAALWICAGEADRNALRDTLLSNGVAAQRLAPCPGAAEPGQVAWGLD